MGGTAKGGTVSTGATVEIVDHGDGDCVMRIDGREIPDLVGYTVSRHMFERAIVTVILRASAVEIDTAGMESVRVATREA